MHSITQARSKDEVLGSNRYNMFLYNHSLGQKYVPISQIWDEAISETNLKDVY